MYWLVYLWANCIGHLCTFALNHLISWKLDWKRQLFYNKQIYEYFGRRPTVSLLYSPWSKCLFFITRTCIYLPYCFQNNGKFYWNIYNYLWSIRNTVFVSNNPVYISLNPNSMKTASVSGVQSNSCSGIFDGLVLLLIAIKHILRPLTR